MPRGLRIALGTLSLLLFAAMIVLLVRGPRFTTSSAFDEPTATVECGSILTIGWPSDGSFINDSSGGFWGDHVEFGPDSLPDGAREGFARDCSERRDTYLGFMIVLSVPANLLAAAALLGRRQQVAATPAPPREPAASA